jgi:uncharacterized membrane protein AbrB (regulator of aidB expression)
MGAAWATLLSFLVGPVLIYFICRKLYPITYEWDRLAELLGVGVLVYMLGSMIDARSLSPLLKIGVLGLFPLLLLTIGFLKENEKQKLRSFLGLRI